MANMHKVSPERFRHLSKLIQIAHKSQDWQNLKRYDLLLRELLEQQQPYLRDTRLQPAVEEARESHKEAMKTLAKAIELLEADINSATERQERAQAYQFAMTMEL